MKMINRLWKDEAGFVVSSELILVGTIGVIGLVVGLATVRDAIVTELADFSGSINNVDQGFTFYGITGHSSATEGSDYVDNTDFCDDDNDASAIAGDACVVIAAGLGVDSEAVADYVPANP